MKGSTRKAYKVRANVLTHGMQVIFDESQARVRKAFYPHRLSSAQFMVQVQVVGEAEYTSLVNWLTGYADYILDPDLRAGAFPSMSVSLPSRNFARKGVPISGYEWVDVVGKMLWEIPLVFETAGEPGEKTPALSRVTGYALYAEDTRYFYPTGIQMSGQEVPDGTYSGGAVTIDDIFPPQTTEAYDPTGTQRRQGGQVK
jgi:hypothetical protein